MTNTSRKIGAALCLAVLVAGPRASGDTQLLDYIAAVVDDDVILYSEVEQIMEVELLQSGMRTSSGAAQLRSMRRNVLDRMVDDRVLLAKARQDSVTVSDKEVEDAVRRQIERLKREHGESAYREELRKQDLTDKIIRDKLREQVRHQFLKDEEMRRLGQRAMVSRREIEDFRKTYADSLPPVLSLSHILIKPDTTAVRARAEQILSRVRAGEDFAELAKRYSDDPGSASLGGELGFFRPKVMVAAFDSAAFSLPVGATSDLVRTEFGYHIVQVEERRTQEVRARHILVALKMDAEEQSRAYTLLDSLRSLVLKGEDFGRLAKEFSGDHEYADENGFLNYFPSEEAPAPFRPTLAGMALGGVSTPFVSPLGMHLLRVNNDDTYVENVIRQRKLDQALGKLIEEEKKKIYVDIRL